MLSGSHFGFMPLADFLFGQPRWICFRTHLEYKSTKHSRKEHFLVL